MVGVVGFVQQLDRQRPAERLRNERVLGGKRKSEGHVRVGPQEFKCEKAGQRFSKNEKKGKKIFCPLCKWFIMLCVSIFKTSLGWVITSDITVLSFWQDWVKKCLNVVLDM